jgi:hypothetical protein
VAAGAGIELKAHPHMLRHACGYALANKGQDTRAIQGWLGHRAITSPAVLYGSGAKPVQGFLAGMNGMSSDGIRDGMKGRLQLGLYGEDLECEIAIPTIRVPLHLGYLSLGRYPP